MATKTIPIKDVCLSGGTQQRPVENDVMRRYAALMKDGVKFPPVEITIDGGNNFLTDGFHRVAAARKNGKKYIEAFVVEGTRREAIFLSFSANKENAFPRQPGTVKRIVEKILKDEQWSKMTQSDIARYVGCTHQFVSKIQAEFTARACNQLQGKTALKGSKTDSPMTPNVQSEKNDEAKVPEKKVLDSTGKQVPEHLVKYFERANEYRQMIKQLNDMLKTVREGKEAGDLFYRYIKIENLTAEIGNVKRIFRFAMPYAVCRYCGGDENNAECRDCDGNGFVNESLYRTTHKDLK